MPKRTRAFTLVELLVVIGIIALLVGILLPVLASAKERSRQTACLATLRQYGVANQVYAGDFAGWYVPAKWGWSQPGAGWPPVPGNLQPPSMGMSTWPSNPAYIKSLGLRGTVWGRVPYGFICPNAILAVTYPEPAGYDLTKSYGYNVHSMDWYGDPPRYYMGFRQGQIHHPSQKLMFADATDWVINGYQSDKYPQYGEQYGPPPLTNITAYRHHKGANVVFWDYHGEWLPMGKIMKNDGLWDPTK
jgi:prepilin-type N-terminal cleavage/methylation domain-containing protein